MLTHSAIYMFAATAKDATEESAGIAALGIDPLAILAQAGTFLLLFFIVKKYAFGSIVDALESRRKTIDSGVRLGVKMEAEYAKLQERIEESLMEARKKADSIVADAHKESADLIKTAEEKAQIKVNTMFDDAKAQISDDMKKAKNELKTEILGMVADATEILIKEKLDEKRDNQLINDFLKGVNK